MGGSNSQLQDAVSLTWERCFLWTHKRHIYRFTCLSPRLMHTYRLWKVVQVKVEDGHLSFLGQRKIGLSENKWGFYHTWPLRQRGRSSDPNQSKSLSYRRVKHLLTDHIRYWQKLNTVDEVELLILTQVHVFILYSLLSFFFFLFLSALFVLHKKPHGREERAEAS